MKKKIAIFIIIFSFITVGVSWAICNNKKNKNEHYPQEKLYSNELKDKEPEMLFPEKTYYETVENNQKNIFSDINIENLASDLEINEKCWDVLQKESELIQSGKTENNLQQKENIKQYICLKILESSTYTQSLILAAGYNKLLAEENLRKHNEEVFKNFQSQKDFLTLYKIRNKELNKYIETKIKKEFPNPYDGRETPIYIDLYKTELLKMQTTILDGIVYDFCLKNESETSCKNLLKKNPIDY